MNTALWLERTARVRGDSPALMLGQMMVADYEAFAGRAAGLAAHLAIVGVGPGDRIGIFAKNVPDYLTCFYAIWRAGAAAVPINAKLHPKEADWILSDAEAKLCFVTDALGDGLAEVSELPLIRIGRDEFEAACTTDPVEIMVRHPSDLAWLFYTSGTTGKPKGVRITHGMLAATSLCYPVDVDPVGPEDAALYAAPMSHGAGIYAPIHVRMGAAHIVPVSGGFDAAEVLDLSEAHGATSMFMAPTMVRRLTDAAKDAGRRGDGIKTIVYGGGPMYRADIEDAVDWFGPQLRADLRAGGVPDGHYRAEPCGGRGPDTSALGGASGFCRAGAVAGRGRDFGRAGRCPATRGDRRDHGARCAGDAGLLEEPRRNGENHRGRVADDGRCRAAGPGWLPHARRPVEGCHHLGRDEHLPSRGGRGPVDPPRCARGLGHRTALCRMGGGRGGLRRRRAGPEVDAVGA
jgi:acyl-CoA synthetase (AMP-forming)/AMP-acid ligase II